MTKLVTIQGKEVSTVENSDDLLWSIMDTYDKHRAGIIDNNEATASMKVANAAIALIKAEIVYAVATNKQPNIRFLNSVKTIEPEE